MSILFHIGFGLVSSIAGIADQSANSSVETVQFLEQTKSVDVQATSETNATLKAEEKNPGWKAVSVEKLNPNDKNSKTYRVKLKKS